MSDAPPDAINAIRQSRSAGELKLRIGAALRAWGFGRFELYWFTQTACLVSLHGGTKPARREPLWLDPFVQHCRVTYTPVVWQSLSPDSSIRQILLWSPWKGLPVRANSGVAFPVHGPDGGFALLSAPADPYAGTVIPPDHVHNAHAAAITAYEVMLTHHKDDGFGLEEEKANPREIATLMVEKIEKSRVLRGANH